MSMFGKRALANDECYTPVKTAEDFVTKYLYLLKDKKVILPCDTEKSELFKACRRHNINCDIAQDMYGVDYSKYDLVFTNPPFHNLSKYIKFLLDKNVKFLLFAPWSFIKYCAINNNIYFIEDIRSGEYVLFLQPNGTVIKVHWGLITNLDEGKAIVEAKPDIRIEVADEFTNYRGIWIDLLNCNYLPYEYKDFSIKGELKVRKKQVF